MVVTRVVTRSRFGVDAGAIVGVVLTPMTNRGLLLLT